MGVAYFVGGGTSVTHSTFGEILDYAIATPLQMPLPAPILATLAAFRFSRRIRRRLQAKQRATDA
jgi:hypothetical protein